MRKDVKILKQEKTKNLRAIRRKIDSLWDAIYKLPKIKLDKPRWSGYKRYWILRDDVSRRKDSKDFLEILNLLNNTVYSRTKDGFAKYDFDDNNLFYSKQRIKTLSTKDYLKLREPLKKYFVRFAHWDFRKKEIRYEFIYSWMFVLKIKHHYITEVPMLDKEMESEIGRLEEKINRDNLWPAIYKAFSRKFRYKDDWDISAKRTRLRDILVDEEILNYVNGMN